VFFFAVILVILSVSIYRLVYWAFKLLLFGNFRLGNSYSRRGAFAVTAVFVISTHKIFTSDIKSAVERSVFGWIVIKICDCIHPTTKIKKPKPLRFRGNP